MENSTKIYIGVGAAALIAFLLFRNKAAAQKPATKTGGGATGGGATTGGGTSGTASKPCPAGQTKIQPTCITAPCPSICVDDDLGLGKIAQCPEGTIAGPRGACVPIDGEPEFIFQPVETPIPSMPSPNPRDSYDYSYDRLNDRFQNERDSYFKDIFQKRGGEYAQF
jgi:hypothetical protein